MGAASTRHSPRPLFSKGERFMHNSGASRRGNADSHLDVIARSEATKQSIVAVLWLWIASRSLSSGAHSRDPLARNDDKCLGCLKMESVALHWSCERAIQCVVPAHAGTHNHRSQLEQKALATVPKREAAAYGSPRARGRH
jgi:hypothetical protein